jgi:hypothetical protein
MFKISVDERGKHESGLIIIEETQGERNSVLENNKDKIATSSIFVESGE